MIEEFAKQNNIPYIPKQWEYVLKFCSSEEEALKRYKSLMKLCTFKNYTWEDSERLKDGI